MRRRRVLFVGDLHVGSVFSIWPRDFRLKSGNRVEANEVQSRLMESFEDMCGRPEVRSADSVFLTGDLCQGGNRKQAARQLVTADLAEQVDAATALLRPLCEKKKVYGVVGTSYHDASEIHLDAMVVKALGGEELGKFAHIRLRSVDRSFYLTHGAKGGAYYTGARADKTATSLLIGMARGKIPRADLWIQGHLHHFWFHITDAIGLLQIPCWQGWYFLDGTLSDYGKKQPDIGAVVVDFYQEGPPVVHPFLYPLPSAETCSIVL